MKGGLTAELILARLRLFLLTVAGLLFLGTVVELGVTGHTQSPIQWIPFGLCALGLLAVLAAWARPSRPVLLGLRASMGLVALGSLLGLYEHISGNLAFQLEIQPNAGLSDVLGKALGGANPLLAPGILALAALLAAAATYAHPALEA
ncbi:MAG: hypothetical protein JNK29_07110 [Anaerolineales bacterium]|nr:hypothetical protein [Anaerolineales bacterium]